MIIACPACNTRYVVPDNAIGVEGRTVRCAKCRHSWFQEGPDAHEIIAGEAARKTRPTSAQAPADRPEPSEEPAIASDTGASTEADTAAHPAASVAAAEDGEARAKPSTIEEEVRSPPSYGTEVAEAEPAIPDSYDDADVSYDQPSQFDYEPPFRSRRNPLKIWTAAAAIFAILAFATIAAVSFWGVPDWVPVQRPTFGLQEPDLQLEFPAEQQDRRTLANGAEYFGASGTVTNIGRESREVPPILIVLRDTRDRIVYSWEVTPPKSTLAPGESVRINEAVTDVPRSAAIAEIGWKPG